ncbi:MAG: hyperosmotically inducible periplasmic protein [Clostridia bacterium]|nr:hyperosmotically inducible periplasmic protein [Clostridia bacterium]
MPEKPAIPGNTHRPVGKPQPREYESQKAQLESLPHGENKEVKRKIDYKTGRADWEEKARLVARRQEQKGLEGRVQAVLDSDKDLKGYGLKAEVNQGKVTLSGIVDTLKEKERAEKLVAGLPGVTGVENGLTISTDGSIDDADVTQEVMEELNADPGINLRHIGAESREGTVILRGNTENPEEIEAAIRAASKARGVRHVVSQVKLKGPAETSLEEIFHSQVRNDEED